MTFLVNIYVEMPIYINPFGLLLLEKAHHNDPYWSDTHLFARRWWPVCGSESPSWQFEKTASVKEKKHNQQSWK